MPLGAAKSGDRQHRKDIGRQIENVSRQGEGGRCSAAARPARHYTTAGVRAAAIAADVRSGEDKVASPDRGSTVLRFGTILRGVANGVPYALASERLLDQDLDENQGGADVAERDERFGATALDWAGWTKQEAVVAYLKSVATRREKFRP
jgi:hypothetical protein